jgi:integrase
MARPRHDGRPSQPVKKIRLTDAAVRKLRPQGDRFYLVWDLKLSGLAIAVHPTGKKVWKCIYSFDGKPRWLTIGKADLLNVDQARKLAADILLKVTVGIDVQAERQASRGHGTFEELATRYREEYAKKKNKSWMQADALVTKNLLPKWAKLRAAEITRSDVKLLLSKMKSASVATQTLRAASAIFSWAIKEDIAGIKANPCHHVDMEGSESRERVLSDTEVPRFWEAFDDAGYLHSLALKMILLTGQRPGEVLRMHRKHIEAGWWTLPGAPVPELGWNGTKNAQTHRVWLPKPAQAIIEGLDGEGLLFAGARGAVIQLAMPMQKICRALGVPGATPHDLRRTHGTLITGLGFGRDAMNRIQNHKDGGIASVYDRHAYADENKKVMEAVAARIMQLVEGVPDNVIAGKKFGARA